MKRVGSGAFRFSGLVGNCFVLGRYSRRLGFKIIVRELTIRTVREAAED